MTASNFFRRHFDRLIRWVRNSARNVQTFHILKIGSALSTQLAALCLVYVLTPSEYGQFALMATVAQLMYTLTSGWSNGVVINLGSQNFARNGTYKAVVLYRVCIVAVAFVAVSLVFLVLRPLVEEHMKIKGLYVPVLMLYVGYVFYDHASQLLYPGNRDRVQAGAELVATGTLLLIVAFTVQDIHSYVIAYTVISTAFACAVSVLFLVYFRDHSFQWKGADFELVLNYSTWQIISVVSIYLINMAMNYFLAIHQVSLEEIGLYNLAYRLYSGFSPFFSLFGILIPKWIHTSKVSVHSIGRNILKIICALAVLYLMFGLVLTLLLQIFKMKQYSGSVVYYFMLFPAFLMTSYINLLNTVIVNTSHFRRAQIGTLLQAGLLMISGFPLVSAFGVSGAIVAITLGSAAGSVYFNRAYRNAVFKVAEL